MIEISQIIIHSLLLIFLTSFPINKYLFLKNSTIKNLNFVVAISTNALFLMFLLLLFSFLRVNLESVFYIISSIYIIMFLKVFFSKKKNLFK